VRQQAADRHYQRNWGTGAITSVRFPLAEINAMSRPALVACLLALCGGACSDGDTPVHPDDPVNAPITTAVTGTIADYEVIDLGSLSADAPNANTGAADINERGQIVGASLTPSHTSQAFIWENGVMTPLDQGDFFQTRAREISEDGRVIYGEGERPGAQYYLLVWEDRVLRVLAGPFADDASIQEASWHGRGRKAFVANIGRGFGFGATQHAVLYHKGQVRDLELLTRPPVVGRDINNKLEVVGQAWADAAAGPGERPDIYHPFVWESGRLRDLGVLGERPCPSAPQFTCGSGWAYAINDRGAIVGGAEDATGSSHALLWERGVRRDLNVGFGLQNLAVGINRHGVVIGQSGARLLFWEQPWVWENGELRRLPTLGGTRAEVAGDNGINDNGEIVGSSRMPGSSNERAVVWRGGRIIDLGNVPGWTSSSTRTLNQRGDIIGSSFGATGVRAILWRRITP
jgi:probable HAF family extracellular repeat protein